MKRMNKKIGKKIRTKDKNKRLCLSILAIIMLLFVSASGYASEIKSDGKTTQAIEEENKTVRVGYFPYSNFQEGSYGEHKQGAGYEYLQKISYITGWKYELCFVNRKSSKSEGKFPTFRSGNPHYPKETCREFSFFSLSSRKESSIHCFLPNRVIRVRLCQRLPERFAFNVLSFDSAPAPG